VFIIYRRTGGVLALLTLAAVAVVATVLSIAVAAALTIAVVALAAVAIARAVLFPSRRHRPVSTVPQVQLETIEATVVNSTGSTDQRHLVSPAGGRRPL
jgi:hypothetical protein